MEERKGMKIYIGHSSGMDFVENLYQPLNRSNLSEDHELVFPHDDSTELFDSKSFLENEADLMVAEVSNASTGLSIELGWADLFDVTIICVYRESDEPSSSIDALDCRKFEYRNKVEMVEKLEKTLAI